MRKNRAAGLTAAGAGLALVAASIAAGGALAEEADGVTREAPTSGAAVMKEQCTWYIEGVQDSVTMAAVEDAEYDGTELEMSEEPGALSVYFSGNEGLGIIDAHSACTWFGEENRDGIEVTMSVDGTSFLAEAAVGGNDDGMDFSASTALPFMVEFTNGGDLCRTGGGASAWEVNPLVVNEMLTSATVMTQTELNTTGVPSDDPGSNDACTSATEWSVTIPANKQPSYPGESYTFTGPTVTTAVEILALP